MKNHQKMFKINKKRLKTAQKSISTSFRVWATPKSWSKHTTTFLSQFEIYKQKTIYKNDFLQVPSASSSSKNKTAQTPCPRAWSSAKGELKTRAKRAAVGRRTRRAAMTSGRKKSKTAIRRKLDSRWWRRSSWWGWRTRRATPRSGTIASRAALEDAFS